MKKILIVEDTETELEEFTDRFREFEQVDTTNDLLTILNCVNNKIELKDNATEYSYVFIHNGYYDKNLEILTYLKEFVLTHETFKLITYSGGTTPMDINNPRNRHIHVERRFFKNNIFRFVDFSIQIDEWFFTAFINDDFKKIYVKKTLSKLNNSFEIETAIKLGEVLGYEKEQLTSLSVEKLKTVLQNG